MTKENSKDNQGPHKDGKTAPPSGSKSKGKNKHADDAANGLLSKIRPRKRFVVFAAFLGICIGIVLVYDTCDVRKKKQDCGYMGVSPLECRTTACFTKGGGEMEKKKVTLKRSKGTKFGIVAGGDKKDDKWVFIKQIKEGAVADHNANLASGSEDMILPRDTITSIDGASGKALRTALKSTDKEKVVIELRRSKLPSYLRWLHRHTQPNFVEKLLTAPGFLTWAATSSKLGGLGFVFWWMSGYPAASLPLYYFGLSGAVAWQTSRCCHDNNVSPGVPHCYKGGSAKFAVAMKRIQTKGQDLFAKVKKNPKSYLKWLSWPHDF